MDVSKLKVSELKDELEKRGIQTTKKLKKDLSDLLEEAIAKENAPADTAPASTAEAPTPADATLAPAAPASTSEEPAFPPVFNESETPLQKTDEQIAQTEREEQAGASAGGAEGAQQAGIAMSTVDPDAKTEEAIAEPAAAGQSEEVEMKEPEGAAVDTAMDIVEEKTEEVPAKRPRVSSVPLSAYPANFVPSSHPPTRALYITNLRRPLADATLADHLESFGDIDIDAGVGKESAGWWLSPVKSHAFVIYTTLEAAVAAYTALQGCTNFPEEPQAGKAVPALNVTFLPPGPIKGLIAQEVKAWTQEGRRKLELMVEEIDGEWELKYKGVGDVNLGRGGVGNQSAMAVGGGGYARGGPAAPPPRAFGGASFGSTAPYARPSSGFGGPGFPGRDAPSSGFRGPPAPAPFSAPGSSQNGYSRPPPPHGSTSSNGGYRDAPRAPYAPPPRQNGGSYDRERDSDRNGLSHRREERTTEAYPRLSYGERDAGRDGRRDDRGRGRDYRSRSRSPRRDRSRDRRDDRDRDRRGSPGERRRDY